MTKITESIKVMENNNLRFPEKLVCFSGNIIKENSCEAL